MQEMPVFVVVVVLRNSEHPIVRMADVDGRVAWDAFSDAHAFAERCYSAYSAFGHVLVVSFREGAPCHAVLMPSLRAVRVSDGLTAQRVGVLPVRRLP